MSDSQKNLGQVNFSQVALKDKEEYLNSGQKIASLIIDAYRRGEYYAENDLDWKIQKVLNEPQKIVEEKFYPSKEDEMFLEDIMNKIKNGTIKLFTPSTLLNMEVYEKLSPSKKAKADFDILNFLNKIREIKKLFDSGNKNTYQMLYLVHSLRMIKERIEENDGDVFII